MLLPSRNRSPLWPVAQPLSDPAKSMSDILAIFMFVLKPDARSLCFIQTYTSTPLTISKFRIVLNHALLETQHVNVKILRCGRLGAACGYCCHSVRETKDLLLPKVL